MLKSDSHQRQTEGRTSLQNDITKKKEEEEEGFTLMRWSINIMFESCTYQTCVTTTLSYSFTMYPFLA